MTPDVILFTPSNEFESHSGRVELLKSVLDTSVCIVALGSSARDIVNKYNTIEWNHVYSAISDDNPQQEELFLQMGFCLSVYESLRADLATPSPLLGLAPIGDSKSFRFQAGEITGQLLIPKVEEIEKAPPINYMIKEAISFLDLAREDQQKDYCDVLDYESVLIENRIISEEFPQVSFMGYFPGQKKGKSKEVYFTAPILITTGDLYNDVDFIPSLADNIIHSYPPVNHNESYYRNYSECFKLLNEVSNFCKSYCEGEDFFPCPQHANETNFSEEEDASEAVQKLLRHIIPVYSIPSYYCCIWRSIKVKDRTSGILIILVNAKDEDRATLLHNICRRITPAGIPSPKVISYEKYSGYKIPQPPQGCDRHEYERISFEQNSTFWVTLGDLKSKLEKAARNAAEESENNKTKEATRKEAEGISADINDFIGGPLNTAIAAQRSCKPGVRSDFIESIRSLANEGTFGRSWGNYLRTDAKNHMTIIISLADEKMREHDESRPNRSL